MVLHGLHDHAVVAEDDVLLILQPAAVAVQPSCALNDGVIDLTSFGGSGNFTYELFLDETGQKISKSSGNGISIDEWLSYASTESLSYFMYQKPKTAKRLFFDVIPRAVDEYHQQLRAYPDQDEAGKAANPVFHIHSGDVPVSNMVVPFAMLLNLASVSGAEDKETLWGFMQRYAPKASPATHPQLDAAAGFAVKYYEDFVKPGKVFRAPDNREREALAAIGLGRAARGDGGPRD